MTHGRLQALTQGRDGISLAHGAALAFYRVARHLLLLVVFSVATLVMGTAGISYSASLEDAVVVSNFGSLFRGSVLTFAAGSTANQRPEFNIVGSNTLLGDGNGAAGDAQSSLNGNIAIAVPLGIAGVFPNGFVEIFPPTSNQNSSPLFLIVSPEGAPDLTGISLGQGVAYEDPFDGVHPFGEDILAVANFTPAVIEPNLGIPELGVCAPNAPGFSFGTITEYDTTFLIPGLNDIPPLNNSPVNFGTHPATIGGCETFLLGPVGVAFDSAGILYVVNELGMYVTAYAPGASGDAIPTAIVGAPGTPTAGAFVDPQYVTVVNDDGDPADDIIAVTDVGTSKNTGSNGTIQFFQPFNPEDCLPVFPFTCFGVHTAELKGSMAKLKRPLGIASNTATGTFYVVGNNKNSLLEFAGFDFTGGSQNVAPTLTISGRGSFLNFPVGVARTQFPPP